MHPWLSSRLDRRSSWTNTLIAVVMFALLGILIFHVFDGASMFFGNSRPRIQTVASIGLSGLGSLLLLFLFGPPRLPDAGKFSVPVLLLITIAICAVIAFYSFASYAWSGDEYAYLFEADTFKALRLWNTPPPLGGHETTSYIWIKDGKWVAQYPPGWPLILALFGGSFPTGRLANGVCTAIAAYAIFDLVRLRANREAAWVAVMLFALSPFALFNGGSLFSHSSAAALSALAMLLSFKAKQSQRLWPLIALGMCIGFLGLTRNVAAFAVVIAVAIDQYRAGQLLRRVIFIGIGGAPFLAALLAYQHAITGHATMPVYWYAGRTLDHLYFDWASIKQAPRLTFLKLSELCLFTGPLILAAWLAAVWKLAKTRNFAAADLIMPLGILIFVFYPLDPYYRAGPRYYFDFWPLAVVSMGAALPRFSADWRKLYAGALAVSVVYAVTITAFMVVELHTIIQSRFDMYEIVKTMGLKNAVVCDSEPISSEGVFARQEYWATARNGIEIGDPAKAAGKEVIFVNCLDLDRAALKAAYPHRSIWNYQAGQEKQAGRLQLLQH